MPKDACLMVRAVVADPSDRAAFDHWYATEHLPQAVAAFGAQSAWRGWSEVDPAIHYAVYWFPSLDAARALTHETARAIDAADDPRRVRRLVARLTDRSQGAAGGL